MPCNRKILVSPVTYVTMDPPQWHWARKGADTMTDCYSLWVDLPNKLISLVEIAGYSKFVYESQEALERVKKLLFADGFRFCAA